VPLLNDGKNVLVVAHGNSIRALKKYIESISDKDVADLEMPFGQIIAYNVSQDGLKKSVSTVTIDAAPPKA